jgi:glycosyltransferase involved in cell wall biosynthesis
MQHSEKKNVISVGALTTGRNVPSSRYRVRQHMDNLREYGINVKEYPPFLSNYSTLFKGIKDVKQFLTSKGKYVNSSITGTKNSKWQTKLWQTALAYQRLPDIRSANLHKVIWLERNLVPGNYTFERFLYKPVILDLDDALWLEKPEGDYALIRNLELAQEVMAGNEFLAQWCRRYNNKVNVIPTSVDTTVFSPISEPEKGDVFRVGWIGTSSNFVFLEPIFPALEAFIKSGRKMVFEVIADRKPQMSSFLSQHTEFIPWFPGVEKRVAKFHVGLMPLLDSEWARGKCSLKMLQYMASGVVPVVSPVGMNSEVLKLRPCGMSAVTIEEWQAQLEFLYVNDDIRREMAIESRKVVLDNFSQLAISRKIATVIHRVAKQ